MTSLNHHVLAKTTTDAILSNFKSGEWTYGEGFGADFYRTGTPADFPSPDAAFYDPTNKKLAYFEFKPATETKRGILTGVGQSIAYLQNSDLSYLVVPKILSGFNLEEYLLDLYTTQLGNKLPTGVITYDNMDPTKVSMLSSIKNLSDKAKSRHVVSNDRFWAKHQDLPIPLFHLLLHYYYLAKVGALTEDPFAAFFKKELISDTILTDFDTRSVCDMQGNYIHTLAGRKHFMVLEKKLGIAKSLDPIEGKQMIEHAINTEFSGDNLYNAYKKNFVSFLKHMHMIDSTNKLTESGFNMYTLGLNNGPNSKVFKDYFIKELLTTGHHLDLILDYDRVLHKMPGESITKVLSLMQDEYDEKGYLKKNPKRIRGNESTVSFLKYERILWKALGITDENNSVNWRLITEICSLPEL